MKIKDKIRLRRKELNLTMLDVANKVGVSEATVSRWESGQISSLKQDKIELLSQILNVPVSYLVVEDESLVADGVVSATSPSITSDFVTFPVIGDIAAGYDKIGYEDWSGDTIDVPVTYLKGHPKEDFFVLKVKGNSMYPLYHDGDKVLILKQSTLTRSGEIGAVLYNDEITTLKKVEYVPGEDWLILIPLNPEYAPERIEGELLEHCRILGVPKLLVREIN